MDVEVVEYWAALMVVQWAERRDVYKVVSWAVKTV